jgi:hypothetical protein
MATLEGGCQCGAVRYQVSGQPVMTALCHCTLCRRAHAAPAVAWAMFQEAQHRYSKGAPAAYASSPAARRWFCAACGTQLGFTAEYIPGLVDISIGSLDRPDLVPPALHYWDAERLPWMKFADGLPVHAAFPPPPA